MKKLHLFVMTIAISVLVACGGGTPSYDSAKCEQLKAKIENKEALTEDDYNDMVDQLVVIAKDLKAEYESVKDDKTKLMDIRNNDELKTKAGYVIGFGMQLSLHKNDLPASTLKKLLDVQEELKSIKDF